MEKSKVKYYSLFLIFFILFSVLAIGLYPQSLFNTIYNFDIINGKQYIYFKNEKLTVICHPVDSEFFSWMLNTEGSPEQYDFLIDLYKKLFTKYEKNLPVFSVNIRNNSDNEYVLCIDNILLERNKVEIYRYTDYAIFNKIDDNISLNSSEEIKLFIFRKDIFIENDIRLESLEVEIEGINFSFEDNPAWDFLKHDIVKYPRY